MEFGINEGRSPNYVWSQPNQVLIASSNPSIPEIVYEGGKAILWGVLVGVSDWLFNSETNTQEATPQAATKPFLFAPTIGRILDTNPPPFPILPEEEIKVYIFNGDINFQEVKDGSLFTFPDESELEYTGVLTTPNLSPRIPKLEDPC